MQPARFGKQPPLAQPSLANDCDRRRALAISQLTKHRVQFRQFLARPRSGIRAMLRIVRASVQSGSSLLISSTRNTGPGSGFAFDVQETLRLRLKEVANVLVRFFGNEDCARLRRGLHPRSQIDGVTGRRVFRYAN